jgi:V8-like Glu-specific endopeptidase
MIAPHYKDVIGISGESMDRLLTLLTLMALSLSAFATEKVIYGDDNRVDVYASTNSDFVELSKSTAAMISNSKLTLNNGSYKIKSSRLGDRLNACSGERFADQPSAANCSGFLVGDKYLVTAGHCIRSASDCAKSSWVFNFKMKNETEANLDIEAKNVFKCKKIVSQALSRASKDDYALIELDRVAADIAPLKFRKSGKIKKNDKLVVIGHPSGLPTKIADGAYVKSTSRKFFSANLDTYGGNSGSAVFNIATGEVEGILVRGATDYVNNGGCRVSNRLGNDEGKGEDVTYITNIAELQNL